MLQNGGKVNCTCACGCGKVVATWEPAPGTPEAVIEHTRTKGYFNRDCARKLAKEKKEAEASSPGSGGTP